MPANEKMPESQFRRIITALCEKWHVPEYADYMTERYWPAFSKLDEVGQRAFWDVLGVQEVSDVSSKDQGGQDMQPRIAIFVRGGVVQEVASDTADVLIKLLDTRSSSFFRLTALACSAGPPPPDTSRTA